MANLGNISTFNINGNEFTLKDLALTNIVEQIITAIGANNSNIAERINDLHNRSFDNTIKISSNNESEISNIQDGLYKIQYITNEIIEEETVETLTNSGILIQTDNQQYLYKNGQLSSRIKINNSWGNWVIDEHPVTSVNGETGNVVIQPNVKANWATTDSSSESFIINKPHITEIKELYYNDTTGLLATSTYSLTFTESLDGYDLVKCYFRATNKNLSSDSNIIPPAILYIPLNEESQLLSGEYSGSVTIPYVDNDNRYAAYRCLISSDKTQFRVVSQTSLYGTAGTNISNASHGIYCYRIEAINTGNLIIDNTQSSSSSFVETDPVFLASPAYSITSTNITNWNNNTFNGLIQVESDTDANIENINDGIYKLKYVVAHQSGLSGDTIYLMTNSAILIKQSNKQYLYKDGIISQRTKTNDTWGSWTEMVPQLKTINNESLIGTGNIVVSGLPQVSSSDNGKILMVVNGQWTLVSPSTLYSGNGVPNNANGNNGDLYMQTD